MRSTWWVTRPKRYLGSVPRALVALADVATGVQWATPDKSTELAIEDLLEKNGVKRPGSRRDRGGGGARTYRSWLKSLGLLFMDDEGRMQLTLAGEAIVRGEPALPVLRKQVLTFQYPSSWSSSGSSAVAPEFRVHPFVLILQLLSDPLLGGYLVEAEDVAKIVICYGTSNFEACRKDLVRRILALRAQGDSSLDADYVERFRSARSKKNNFDELIENHRDIANTIKNWLAYSQLIVVEEGRWLLNPSMADVIDETLADPPTLIDRPRDEEYFQRRYGLDLVRKKDTRDLSESKTVTSAMIRDREMNAAMQSIASRRVVIEVTSELVGEVADLAAVTSDEAERFLRGRYPNGLTTLFLSEYADMAAQSRARATEFEVATVEIFRNVFGYRAEHIGAHGIVPDIYLESDSEQYCAILDNKAYSKGYSISNDHRNRMVYNYIPTYSQVEYQLAFFSYIATEYKPTINRQVHAIVESTGVGGSVVTATDIIRMVEMHMEKPFTHATLRELFSLGRAITLADIEGAHRNS